MTSWRWIRTPGSFSEAVLTSLGSFTVSSGHFLAREVRRALATAFIASRVDHCNVVFYGVAKSTIHLLQLCLNAAARLVTGFGKYEHITSMLRDNLQCLPVEQRVKLKIEVLAFDCHWGAAYFRPRCLHAPC
jgi:hypothetical protein